MNNQFNLFALALAGSMIFSLSQSVNAACTCPAGYSPTTAGTLICSKSTVVKKWVNAACDVGYVIGKNDGRGNKDVCNTAFGIGGNGKPTKPEGIIFTDHPNWHLDIRSGYDKFWKNERSFEYKSCLQ